MSYEKPFAESPAAPVPSSLYGTRRALFHLWQGIETEEPPAPKDMRLFPRARRSPPRALADKVLDASLADPADDTFVFRGN